MARKTYHHLQVGDAVTLEHYVPEGTDVRVEALIMGTVTKVLHTRVEIRFQWQRDNGTFFEMHQLFSRQGGQRWGADDYRIHPGHAQTKVAK
jgi:hypothetical protein